MKQLCAIFLMLLVSRIEASVRLNASPDSVTMATQATDWDDGGATIMAWVYVVNARGVDTALVSIRGAGIAYINTSGNLALYTGSSQYWTLNTPVTTGAWHHVALVRDGSVWRVYLDGVADVFATQLVEPTGDPQPRFGNDNYDDWLDGRVAAGKIWLRTLNISQIQAETNSFAPVDTANIWSAIPMHVHTDLSDTSGQGNNATAVGILTTEADPPIGGTTTNLTLQGKINISGKAAFN
jgi:hypothetical protein